MSPPQRKPKSAENNPNFEESSSEENYPEKPPLQSKPLPQPQTINPLYSTNPAGRVGYVPPHQTNGRSPGYADLGIKHIPAYAQPPSLNSSMEHNMGPQPNGVNGHGTNVNPNPYSRPPIVMATPGHPNMATMNQKRQLSLSGSMASLGSETGV